MSRRRRGQGKGLRWHTGHDTLYRAQYMPYDKDCSGAGLPFPLRLSLIEKESVIRQIGARRFPLSLEKLP